MKRGNIIVVLKDSEPECWGNFKKMCLAKGLPYHSLKVKDFPIEHEGYKIYKVVFN